MLKRSVVMAAVLALLLTMVSAVLPQVTPRQVYEKNFEATVKILLVNMRGGKAVPIGTGSGFMITPKGQIFTNRHVIEESVYGPADKKGKAEIVVQVWNSQESYDLYMAKVDFYSTKFDGAQISIISDLNGNAVTKKFKTISIGDAEKLIPGQQLVILGFPAQYADAYGQDPDLAFKETSTLTRGIVSGYDPLLKMYKTDTKITPGNSGGPVYDEDGKVIGIATAKFKETGLGLVGGINNMYYVASKDVVAYAKVPPAKKNEAPDAIAAERRQPEGPKTKPGRNKDVFADEETPEQPKKQQPAPKPGKKGANDIFGDDETPKKQEPRRKPQPAPEENEEGTVEVSGVVSSADAGTPIEGVTVALLVKRGEKAEIVSAGKTNKKGMFALAPRVKPGEYFFAAVANGYEKVVERVTVPAQDWAVKVTMNRE